RRGLVAAAEIRRQHRLIAMQIVEETSVALPRMTGVAGALQKAEKWLGSTVAAAAALLVVGGIVVLFTGVFGALLLSTATDLVGRTRRHSLSVARDARFGRRLPARRTYAHDSLCRHGQRPPPRLLRRARDRSTTGLSRPRAAASGRLRFR